MKFYFCAISVGSTKKSSNKLKKTVETILEKLLSSYWELSGGNSFGELLLKNLGNLLGTFQRLVKSSPIIVLTRFEIFYLTFSYSQQKLHKKLFHISINLLLELPDINPTKNSRHFVYVQGVLWELLRLNRLRNAGDV